MPAKAVCGSSPERNRGSRRSRRRERVLAQAERSAALTAEVGLWHPRKTWFVLHQRGRFLAANATPRLRVSP